MKKGSFALKKTKQRQKQNNVKKWSCTKLWRLGDPLFINVYWEVIKVQKNANKPHKGQINPCFIECFPFDNQSRPPGRNHIAPGPWTATADGPYDVLV